MPRGYTLGKRAETKADTRDRIIAATLGLYREVGVAGATVPAIARAADVAPATVRNHFPDLSDLASAAAAAILADTGMPDASILDGVTGLRDRLERLLAGVAAFNERATGWWQVREEDRGAANVWASAEAAYNDRLAGLIREAIGPVGDDPAVVAVVEAVIVQVYFAMRSTGVPSEEAVAVETALLVPWLEARSRSMSG